MEYEVENVGKNAICVVAGAWPCVSPIGRALEGYMYCVLGYI